MDFSKLTEDQKQQLQQLHQQFQQHQQEQQKKQQEQQQQQVQSYEPSPVQPYDPSQSQTYDPSYYQYQQYHQSYYQPDYANAYQPQPQNESAPIQPPGVSAAPETTAPIAQQNPYYPPPVGAEQHPVVPSGLNPAAAAAVAALSQLTQFAGTMDAAERAMAGIQDRQWPGMNVGYGPPGGPMQMQMPPYMPHYPGYGEYHQGPYQGHMGGRPPYIGGGKRGGPPFRGGGRGNYGQRPPRGRGRGGKGRNPLRATSSNLETSGGSASMSEHIDGGALAMAHERVPKSTNVARSGKAASSTKKQPQIAWCELCRVDCTSSEILEQHKNGKKHKKNLQRFEELQKSQNPPVSMAVTVTNPSPAPTDESAPIPTSDPSQEESQSVPNSEIIMAQPETIEGGVTNNTEPPPPPDSMIEAELGNGEQTDTSGNKRKLERFDTRTRGANKKMRGGRGGKKARSSDRQTKAIEPPKQVVPIICDLCNVKCDTTAVFQTHLGGKKHIAKLKRFQGHQAMYGPLGLQALYPPPNPNTQPIIIPQAHQPPMHVPDGSFNHYGQQQEPTHENQSDMPLEFKGQQPENNVVSGVDAKMDDGTVMNEGAV